MKKMQKTMIVLGLIVLLVAACAPFAGQGNAEVTDAPNVDLIVAQTFAAMTVQSALSQPVAQDTATSTPTLTPTVTVTPTPVPGSISGELSYPSQFIPAMRVVAFVVGGFNYRYVDTMENDRSYQITGLAPGKYHVVAYTLDGTLSGGYTQAVPCGLSFECADHSLIEVTVISGQVTADINPADWYAPEGTFPPMPLP